MYIRGLTNNASIISEIPGRRLSGLTIPPEVLVTSSRPDLVIHYPDANVIKILELTLLLETNIETKEHIQNKHVFHPKGPLKCYVTFFCGNWTPTHPLVTLITLNLTPSKRVFPEKLTPHPHLHYETLE